MIEGIFRKNDMSDIDNYSPVAQWYNSKLMFISSIILNLKSNSTDFNNTFYQADTERPPVYTKVTFAVPEFNKSVTILCMMINLESNILPDIYFEVHQCARLILCMESFHNNAVLQIFKNLKATQK